jgi:hypothetical protein
MIADVFVHDTYFSVNVSPIAIAIVIAFIVLGAAIFVSVWSFSRLDNKG